MKKLVTPLVLLIVGLVAGYYAGKLQTGTLNLDPNNLTTDQKKILSAIYRQNAFILADPPQSPHHIDSLTAKKMVIEFQKDNNSSLTPLLTVDGKNLNGYFMDREPLDRILANKSWKGISIYLGKVSDHVYTLIYMGSRDDPKKPGNLIHLPEIKPGTNLTVDGDTLSYDFVKPCPTVCNDF